MLQFSPIQRTRKAAEKSSQSKILFTICEDQYNLYWDLLWFIYSIPLKEFDKTLVKSVRVKTRPYIKECYNECWWVRM